MKPFPSAVSLQSPLVTKLAKEKIVSVQLHFHRAVKKGEFGAERQYIDKPVQETHFKDYPCIYIITYYLNVFLHMFLDMELIDKKSRQNLLSQKVY